MNYAFGRVIKMKRITAFLCTALIAITLSYSYADDDTVKQINIYDLNQLLSEKDTHSAINLNWLVERYDFGQIESYIADQYGTYYRYEQYVTNKQREIAGKFGLTSIYVRPSFKRYDDSKLILTRNVWDDKLTLRYLAPLRDMGEFEIMMAFRPIQSINLIIKSEINGESSIAAAITRPLGKKSEDGDTMRFTKRALKKIAGIKM
jgi:hypothetical protein